MKKNVKKILAVALTLAFTVANGGLWCLAAGTDAFEVDCSSYEECMDKAEKRYLKSHPFLRVNKWLGEKYKEYISDDKVDNTALSLIWELVKKGLINVFGVMVSVVAWAWRVLFRIPGTLCEFLSGYKSDKIHELSAENLKLNVNTNRLNKNNAKLASDLQKSQAKLEELQKMINLCNKNKTCKVLLNDLLKNGK